MTEPVALEQEREMNEACAESAEANKQPAMKNFMRVLFEVLTPEDMEMIYK